MRDDRLDALVLTTPANLRYVAGHEPLLALAPTRPWYVVLPADGEPIGVVPEIGIGDAEAEGAFGALRSWPSPRFDGSAEGVAEVVTALSAISTRHGRVGMELGRETRLGMSHADFGALVEAIQPREPVDASALIHAARTIKSDGEIARIAAAARAAQAGFDTVREQLRVRSAGSGTGAITERDLARAFTLAAIASGADGVPYLALGSGRDGYDSLTRAPTDRTIIGSDIVGLDAGARVDGYWCDYNRNFAVGEPASTARDAHRTLQNATETGIAALRPGIRASDAWSAITQQLPDPSRTARYGHGVGLDLTEPPSIHANDHTVLREGMVLTIEPSTAFTTKAGTGAVLDLPDDGGGPVVHYAAARSKAMGLI